jgi:membrane protein YqaA with SNARE-associated domain
MKIVNLGESNSVLNRFVAELRDVNIQKDSMRFRRNIERIGEIMAYEISKDFTYSKKGIQSPLGIAPMNTPDDSVVISTILRAGLPYHQGFLVFKFWWGFILNYIGINIGSIILFWLARRYGKKFCLLFMNEETFDKHEKKVDNKRGYEIFFVFCMLFPFTPADIVVMISGLTSMSYRKFISIILICRPFSIIAYSYFWIYGSYWLNLFLK